VAEGRFGSLRHVLRSVVTGALALAGSIVCAAIAVAAPLPGPPAWWTPNASLSVPPRPPQAVPASGTFNDGLTGWTLLGPGKVDVRDGGPAGNARFAAIRDNTTLVSPPFAVARDAQVLTLWARALQGQERIHVSARVAGAAQPIDLGTLAPGRSWGLLGLTAAPVAGRTIQLQIDPDMAFNQGIDLARVGGTLQVAPGFTLRSGVVRRLATGPAGVALGAQSGPLTLDTAAVKVPGDAVTVSLWMRALASAQPTVSLSVGPAVLATGVATAIWTPLRAPASTLRRQRVRLTVSSPEAGGLELAWVGTIQRAPLLHVGTLKRKGKRVRIGVRTSTAVVGSEIGLERQVPAGWQRLASATVDANGHAVFILPVTKAKQVVRAVFAGSEAVAPGASPTRVVRGRG
jgi:hypothetical protein